MQEIQEFMIWLGIISVGAASDWGEGSVLLARKIDAMPECVSVEIGM